MKIDIKDKYVVISGASGGIGKCLAEIFIKKYGARVIGIARGEEKLQKVHGELGERFTYSCFDVSDKDKWAEFARGLKEGGISPVIVINNAGIFPPICKTTKCDSDVTMKVIKTNFMSAVYGAESMMPLMRNNEKAVLYSVASSAALCAVAGTAAYTASKKAISGYMEALRLENNGNIRIGIAYPGVTQTDLFRSDGRIARSGVDKIASKPGKIAAKIARAAIKGKRRIIVGFDAVAMNILCSLMPLSGPKLIAGVMRKSKAEAFDGLFTDDAQK